MAAPPVRSTGGWSAGVLTRAFPRSRDLVVARPILSAGHDCPELKVTPRAAQDLVAEIDLLRDDRVGGDIAPTEGYCEEWGNRAEIDKIAASNGKSPNQKQPPADSRSALAGAPHGPCGWSGWRRLARRRAAFNALTTRHEHGLDRRLSPGIVEPRRIHPLHPRQACACRLGMFRTCRAALLTPMVWPGDVDDRDSSPSPPVNSAGQEEL